MGPDRYRGDPRHGHIALLVIMALSFGSLSRNALWRDEIALWTDAVEKSPQKSSSLVNLGTAYADRGEVRQALHWYERARMLDPESVDIMVSMANVQMSLGRPDLALVLYRQARERTGGLPAAAYVNMGNAYSDLGEADAAIDCYRAAMKEDPTLPGIYYNMAVVSERTGEFAAAEALYRKALELDPEYSEVKERLHILRSRVRSEIGRSEYHGQTDR